MDIGHVNRLLEYASPALSRDTATADGMSEGLGKSKLTDELFAVLGARNGFFAYGRALHVFPFGRTVLGYDLTEWNAQALWRDAYGAMAADLLFFAEDAIGEQFAIFDDKVVRFNPETAEILVISSSISGWIDIIVGQPVIETGYRLLHHWEQTNRALKPNERLVPKTFVVLGGDYSVANFYAGDAATSLQLRGEFASRIHELPDGSKIRIKIVP